MARDTVIGYSSFVTPIERFPVLPSIFMDKVHSNDRNEYKKEPHDAEAPWSLHNRPNEQLNVVHRNTRGKDNL